MGLAEGTRGRHTPPLAATVRGIGHAGRTLVAEMSEMILVVYLVPSVTPSRTGRR